MDQTHPSYPIVGSQATQTREAHKVTLIGAGVDVVVGLAKTVTGLLVGSAALVADGIHSFSDVLTDVFVMVATHFGRQERDSNHPYGHGRIESLATLWLGSVLIFAAGAIAWASLSRLIAGEAHPPAPGIWAIGVAVLALLSKEWIYRYTLRVSRRLRSPLLAANAWHSRSDALSTVVVLIGLLGGQLGVGSLDAVAAIVVGVMVGQVGGRLLWGASQELIDTALPEEDRQRMREIAEGVPEVDSVHDLRARTLGSETVVDLHIVVRAMGTVSESHEIGNEVARRLRDAFSSVTDVTFHIDPENDEAEVEHSLRPRLPLRHEIERMLDRVWSQQPVWRCRAAFELHYIDEQIDISLYVSDLPAGQSLDEAAARLRRAASELKWIGAVRLWQGPGGS